MNVINNEIARLMAYRDDSLQNGDGFNDGWKFDEEEHFNRMDQDETFHSSEIEDQIFYQDGLLEVW